MSSGTCGIGFLRSNQSPLRVDVGDVGGLGDFDERLYRLVSCLDGRSDLKQSCADWRGYPGALQRHHDGRRVVQRLINEQV